MKVKECTIVLLNDGGDVDTLSKENKIGTSHFIFLWCNPSNIAGIIEMNYKVRALRATDNGLMYDIAIIDLHKGGFPLMSPERTIEEYFRVADLYLEAASKEYTSELINFIKLKKEK